MAASIVRDEMPWLYELAMEVYRAVKAKDANAIEREMRRLHRFSEAVLRGPFMEEFGFTKESYMFAHQLPRMLDHMMMRSLEAIKRRSSGRRKTPKSQSAAAAAE